MFAIRNRISQAVLTTEGIHTSGKGPMTLVRSASPRGEGAIMVGELVAPCL